MIFSLIETTPIFFLIVLLFMLIGCPTVVTLLTCFGRACCFYYLWSALSKERPMLMVFYSAMISALGVRCCRGRRVKIMSDAAADAPQSTCPCTHWRCFVYSGLQCRTAGICCACVFTADLSNDGGRYF